MDKIRLGFIGCGGNASGHMGRLLEIPEAEIVALCDPSEESIRRAQERHQAVAGLPVFSDYRDLLSSVEVDAIEISTPHTTHFDQIMDSLDRGAHVLTEKPMVCSVGQARAVIAKAEAVGRILMVAYQRHLMSHFRFIRNQIRCGELGEIQFISALQDQGWYRGTAGTWRQQLALSGGGQLNDSGSHLVDIILWMTGLEPAEVQAFVESFDSEVDINSALSVRFTNGALCNFSVVGNSPVRGMWEDITIWGSKAVVYIRNGKVTYKVAGSDEALEPAGLPGASNPDRNFLDAIRGRDEVQVPAECGLRVIQLTEAAWESARIGGPVKVKTE